MAKRRRQKRRPARRSGGLAAEPSARRRPMSPPTDAGEASALCSEPVPYRVWGERLDPQAVAQMDSAARLPIAVKGALMPDAHVGYGLPIGGVLATLGAVIPYAVGMDIGCRMRLTLLDRPVADLTGRGADLIDAIEQETAFGTGCGFSPRRQHAVMDDDWSVSSVTDTHRDHAWRQLGSSGSGNHFVEFGELTTHGDDLGVAPGRYLALLSHSGSRHVGLQVATHYSRIARDRHPELPRPFQHLAWLDLASEAGLRYWQAMQLMGRYAAANHELIHRHVLARLGAESLATVENHHNFAWVERHGGREVVVHRKGATPAAADQIGVIPGTMATPAYVVRGTGHPDSLASAAHGAGRAVSRRQALQRFRWQDVETLLQRAGVTLLSAGLDEIPLAYKDIDEVMAAQRDLVRIVARFDPRLVKMAPGKGGRRRR